MDTMTYLALVHYGVRNLPDVSVASLTTINHSIQQSMDDCKNTNGQNCTKDDEDDEDDDKDES